MNKLRLIKDESALAFPVTIGLACIFIGLGLWMLMDEIITPMQTTYTNTNISFSINGTSVNLNQTDINAGYLNQAWGLSPLLISLFGIIYILVNSQKQ